MGQCAGSKPARKGDKSPNKTKSNSKTQNTVQPKAEMTTEPDSKPASNDDHHKTLLELADGSVDSQPPEPVPVEQSLEEAVEQALAQDPVQLAEPEPEQQSTDNLAAPEEAPAVERNNSSFSGGRPSIELVQLLEALRGIRENGQVKNRQLFPEDYTIVSQADRRKADNMLYLVLDADLPAYDLSFVRKLVKLCSKALTNTSIFVSWITLQELEALRINSEVKAVSRTAKKSLEHLSKYQDTEEGILFETEAYLEYEGGVEDLAIKGLSESSDSVLFLSLDPDRALKVREQGFKTYDPMLLKSRFEGEMDTKLAKLIGADLWEAASTDTAAEPESETAVEPESEPAVEPESEPAVEPESEPAAEPESAPAAEPESASAAEPAAAEPAAEPAENAPAEPAESEPAAEPENTELANVEVEEGEASVAVPAITDE